MCLLEALGAFPAQGPEPQGCREGAPSEALQEGEEQSARGPRSEVSKANTHMSIAHQLWVQNLIWGCSEIPKGDHRKDVIFRVDLPWMLQDKEKVFS